jgi:hypothetical protein
MGNIADPKARDMITKQRKQILKMDMQILASVTQMKALEASQKALEEYKIKELVVAYFTEQFEWLNINKLKTDFEDVTTRLRVVEEQMTAKMKEVEVMYEEVDSGFNRNARDRSDYLNHYERI